MYIQIVDIISRWEVLEKLARDRQVQSRDLAGIYAEVQSMKSAIEDSTAVLNHNCYEDVLDLEETIKKIQVQIKHGSITLYNVTVGLLNTVYKPNKNFILLLQSSKVDLVQQRGRLVGIQGRVQDYAKCNPRVRMGKFKEELLNIETRLTSEPDR